MELNWHSFRPRDAAQWTFVVSLVLQVAGAIAFAIAGGHGDWLALWLVSAAGSALILSASVWMVDIVASSQSRRAAITVRVVAGIFVAVGWLFSVLVSTIVAFHPIYLIFMLMFTGIAVGMGLAVALVVGSLVDSLRPAQGPAP